MRRVADWSAWIKDEESRRYSVLNVELTITESDTQ
jgi:hypothetical protein